MRGGVSSAPADRDAEARLLLLYYTCAAAAVDVCICRMIIVRSLRRVETLWAGFVSRFLSFLFCEIAVEFFVYDFLCGWSDDELWCSSSFNAFFFSKFDVLYFIENQEKMIRVIYSSRP